MHRKYFQYVQYEVCEPLNYLESEVSFPTSYLHRCLLFKVVNEISFL